MTELVPPDQRDRQLAASERRRREYLAQHPPADPRGLFAQPGVWLSAEIRSLGWTGQEIARRAKDIGAKWAALDSAVNETGDVNVARFQEVAKACENVGIEAILWGHNPSPVSVANRIAQTGTSTYIVNREAANQTDPGFLAEVKRLCPATTFAVVAGPFDAFPNAAAGQLDPDPERAAWQELVMLVEAYTGENPQATPEAQAFQAIQRGFDKLACVVESNEGHGWTLEQIDTGEVRRVFGHGVSLYMLGTASADDLLRFKAMTT